MIDSTWALIYNTNNNHYLSSNDEADIGVGAWGGPMSLEWGEEYSTAK